MGGLKKKKAQGNHGNHKSWMILETFSKMVVQELYNMVTTIINNILYSWKMLRNGFEVFTTKMTSMCMSISLI